MITCLKNWFKELKNSDELFDFGIVSIIQFFWFFLKVGFGFLLLTPFLFIVKCTNKEFYQDFTHWANLEVVPDIDKCITKRLPDSDSMLGPNRVFYEVEISTNINDKIGSVILFSRKQHVDIYDIKCKDKDKVPQPIPYKILWNQNINNLENEKIKIIVNDKYISFKDGVNLKNKDCPIRAEIILDEKD